MFLLAVEDTLDRAEWEVLGELLLMREPMRADIVVLRRRHGAAVDDPPRLRTVLDRLRAHNVLHLKGPSDALDADDATQLLIYGLQYLKDRKVAATTDMSLRVVARALTPRFLTQVGVLKGELAKTERAGVHEGTLGPFALRVVETGEAHKLMHEHLLYFFDPDFLEHRAAAPTLDTAERRLYLRLYRCVEQMRYLPEAPMIEDLNLAEERLRETIQEVIPLMPRELVLKCFKPEERLSGLKPEERLAGLSESDQVLALPDHLLRLLPEDYLATLPADTQTRVRARRGR